MFTGIIQALGRISSIERRGRDIRMECSITPRGQAFANLVVGESIAVNGCCLSVESHEDHVFTCFASEETSTHSTIGLLQKGSLVNLERALQGHDRLGGHIVTGHVDCIGEVAGLEERGESIRVLISFPPAFAAQIVPKGSVTLDGISLTVNEVTTDTLSVNIIPETQKETTMRHWQKGSKINIETDILGKYVMRALELRDEKEPKERITKDFLARHGFLS
ncbi:MAG: riboflavin synthase [Desulfovibrio sp.]|nr:riboflavin synthase [Desulfovibrio sp.]